MLREVEKRTGRPVGFDESELGAPRYFSAANSKNRLESHFQMVDQKRTQPQPQPAAAPPPRRAPAPAPQTTPGEGA